MGHMKELNPQPISPPQRLYRCHLVQILSQLVMWLVFLAWPAPVLSHLLNTDYQRTHHESPRYH